MVPEAQARGIRRVRFIDPCWRVGRAEAQRRVDWLRGQLEGFVIPQIVTGVGFDQQTFGVEFELLMPVGMTKRTLADHLIAEGVPCIVVEHYSQAHNATPHTWKIVPDGSLGDYVRGAEVVSPPLNATEEGFAVMRKVAAKLQSVGCTVNRHCGFHVHVGARNRDVNFFKRLWRAYWQYEPAIDSVIQPDRRMNNRWCRPLSFRDAEVENATDMRGFATAMRAHDDSARYHKLNFNSYRRHGTVEFRQHGGTVEVTKAEMWVRFCLRLTAWASSSDAVMPSARSTDRATASDLQKLFDLVGADLNEQRYLNDRAARFARRAARQAARAGLQPSLANVPAMPREESF